MFNTETTEQQSSIFGQNPFWLKICLIVMFLLAALIRRDEIRAPGYAITREYNSAIFARAFYVEHNDNLDEWRRNIAIAAKDQLPLLEPPLTEYLVSWIYRILGREEIWYARYLTGLFWLIGGIFLYKIVRILISADAAIVAVGYYLFIPMGIKVSRSFQPDSLMMMMFLISLYFILMYFEQLSWCRLILAGITTGVTLLIRPLVLFALFGAFVAVSIFKKGKWLDVIDKQFTVFSFLSLAFPIAFYGYGIFVAGFLQGLADLSFRPYLLIRWEFWRGWFEVGADVAGHTAVIAVLLGLWLFHKSHVRNLVIGLMIGYFVFGLVFNYHIYSHDYYHIQLFPIIGICIAPLVVKLANIFKRLAGGNWWMPVMASLLVILYFSWRDVRGSLYTAVFEEPGLAREVGEAVGHSRRVVFVAYHYGLPLVYYGEIAGAPWPVSIDDPFYRRPDAQVLSVQERLDGLGFIPEYFLITNFDLFNGLHQDLREYLEGNCTVFAQTEQYLIYGSCQASTNIKNAMPPAIISGH
jgi:4-amino-4-deoxy-L-arabinose transferase-like glycosyltransferase